MQRGIDTYFKRSAPAPKPAVEEKTKKRRIVISSDEDDDVQIIASSNDNKSKRTRPNDEEIAASPRNKKPSLSKLKSSSPRKELKRVDPASLFGGTTIRVEGKKAPKPKDKSLDELENDEINQSLLDVIDGNEVNGSHKSPTPKKKFTASERSEHEEKSSAKKTKVAKDDSLHKSESKISPKNKTPPKKNTASERSEYEEKSSAKKTKVAKDDSLHKSESKISPKNKTPSKKNVIDEKKEHIESAAKKPKMSKIELSPKHDKTPKHATPKEKKGANDLETSVLSDEERFERRRIAAQAYQHYKNRPSCLNPGSKEVPKGKPNCLNNLSFLVSGILESLTRDEVASIVKEYGGKMMTTAGKRLNYLIAGEDVGYKKLEQAKENGTRIISEDDFFDLIRGKSGESKPSIKSNDIKKEITPEKIEKTKHIDTKHEKEMKLKSPKKEFNNNEVKIKVEQTEIPVKPAADESLLAWVDKYKPSSVKDIIGQQGGGSNVAKLTNWLSRWYTNHDGKKKLVKPSPWAKNDDGGYFKAALLSGPPGIGKTTTATLVCKELGFDAVEFNASDTRSKRLLKEEVAELLSNKSLYGYFHGKAQAITKKHVLIMDEVDGMAGNEDRGGIQELIALIKESSVPIICMCNDRNHQKMRSLVNYCYDLRFNKPRMEQIRGRILSICCREQFKLDASKIEEIIAATNNDIRQSINHISLLSAGKELALKSAQSEKTASKDLKMGPWEVVRKVFSVDEHKHMSFQDKCDLFFHDYSLSPLFVQQNYLQVTPVGPKSDVLRKVAMSADALSLGDLVDKRIRTNSAWSLLPVQGVFSSVMPGEYMCGHFTGQINFPGWLGKNSRANKRNRLAQEIHDHTRVRTSGSRQSVRLDYAPFILANIARPLVEKGMDGVEESLNVIKEYHLLREDIESLTELSSWPGRKSPFDAVDGRVKAALTRTYNKEVLAYSYSAMAGVKKKKAESRDENELLELDGEDEIVINSDDEKEDDNLENDGLIKAKKKPAAAAAKATSTKAKPAAKTSGTSKSKAGTSKVKK